MPAFDDARDVREGEQLDETRLSHYLAQTLGGPGPLVVRQFRGGHSNLTYLVRWGADEYVLRRPPVGSKVKSAHDMGREHRILSQLSRVCELAPRPTAFCEDTSILGVPFYLMNRLRGVILRREIPDGLAIDESTARALCASAVDVLCDLHRIDLDAAGLSAEGRPIGYVERQVTGWTRRYVDAQTDDIGDIDATASWLATHMPASGPPTLLHNDYKFDNLVLEADNLPRIVGILDWEMSTVGDPLMDLGTALSYWVQADDPPLLQAFRFGPTTLPGMMSRREIVDAYAQGSGRDVSHIVFYYCFGLFKTAVVAQQIYHRFAKGLTSDARFAQFIYGVKLLASQAAVAIESGRL